MSEKAPDTQPILGLTSPTSTSPSRSLGINGTGEGVKEPLRVMTKTPEIGSQLKSADDGYLAGASNPATPITAAPASLSRKKSFGQQIGNLFRKVSVKRKV